MSDSPKSSTGYGTVMDNLLRTWATYYDTEFEFFHIGWQNFERPHERKIVDKEGNVHKYVVLPRAKEDYGYDVIGRYINALNPDVVITLCDMGFQQGYIPIINELRKHGWGGKWLAYVPLDTNEWAMTWEESTEQFDYFIAMSKWGELMAKANTTAKVICIPHGVDTELYQPDKNKEENKAESGLNNKFVVGAVGRNQTRKMWAYQFKAFARFSKDKNDVVMLLHVDEESPSGWMSGWSLPYIAWKYNISPRKIKLTLQGLSVVHRFFISPARMARIYNLMDLYFFLTGGEGFGLPTMEAMSCGVPVMTTAYTTGFEFVFGDVKPEQTKQDYIPETNEGKSGWLVNPLRDRYGRHVKFIGYNGVSFVIPDDIHAAQLLEKAYEDWKNGGKLLKQKAKEARKIAEQYDWKIIAKKWIDLFKKIV